MIRDVTIYWVIGFIGFFRYWVFSTQYPISENMGNFWKKGKKIPLENAIFQKKASFSSHFVSKLVNCPKFGSISFSVHISNSIF